MRDCDEEYLHLFVSAGPCRKKSNCQGKRSQPSSKKIPHTQVPYTLLIPSTLQAAPCLCNAAERCSTKALQFGLRKWNAANLCTAWHFKTESHGLRKGSKQVVN